MAPQKKIHRPWMLLITWIITFAWMVIAGDTNTEGVCAPGIIPWNPSAKVRFGLSLSLRKAFDQVRISVLNFILIERRRSVLNLINPILIHNLDP